MKLYNGSVIVWTNKGNRIFNDIKLADKYYSKQARNNPIWERVFSPHEKKAEKKGGIL